MLLFLIMFLPGFSKRVILAPWNSWGSGHSASAFFILLLILCMCVCARIHSGTFGERKPDASDYPELELHSGGCELLNKGAGD